MRLPIHLPKHSTKPPSGQCTSCGFLGYTLRGIPGFEIPPRLSFGEFMTFTEHYYKPREVRLPDRQQILAHKHPRPETLLCERQIWVYGDPTLEQANNESFFSLLTQQRHCKYFYSHSPGFSPQQHLDLEREHRTNILLVKATITAAIIGAIIGAAAVIIAELVT